VSRAAKAVRSTGSLAQTLRLPNEPPQPDERFTTISLPLLFSAALSDTLPASARRATCGGFVARIVQPASPQESVVSMAASVTTGKWDGANGRGADAPGKAQIRQRILVVDDDAGSRTALETLLLVDGFETSRAADGEAALADAARELPDLVLTDLQMPLMDGVQLCQRLHEIDRDLPVIIMTAHSDMQSVIDSLRAGAEDYLLKPVLADAVLWCVKRALGRRAAAREHELLRRTLNERLVLSSIREQEHADAEALQRAQLNALLENLSEGVAIAEPDGRIVMINAAARAMLGFWNEAPSIRALHALEARDLEGRILEARERPLLRALLGGQFTDYEILRVRPDGERRRIVSTGTSVKDADGKVALAIVVFRDVTELRRLELQRDEHLALISHDLRNPLSTVLMALSMLGSAEQHRSAEQPDSQQFPLSRRVKLVERAERNARRMGAMLDELTDAMKLAARGVELCREPCDLRALVAGVIDSLDDARAQRISIETDPASTYRVLGDASRLERVVANLLTNALKYSADDAPVIARLANEGGSVAIDVVDRGIGIAPESVQLLFGRYYRTTAGKAQASGLGLGLYISRLIVEAHGGKVAVSSEVDKGSTFRVTLPSHTS
jgi:PAS domain S-box-containing protein